MNYEDPNLNVAIPVFSIHGNHDDPQGAGAVSLTSSLPNLFYFVFQDGALCALDILSVSGLVNYMGKIDLPLSTSTAQPESMASGIAVRPVLLRKGKTKLGLYGVGNVKDQRMHFELRSNRVKMFMPRDKQSWFNLLVLHQNRWVLSSRFFRIYLNSTLESNTALKNMFLKGCLTIALTLLFGVMNTTAESRQNQLPARIITSLSLVRRSPQV